MKRGDTVSYIVCEVRFELNQFEPYKLTYSRMVHKILRCNVVIYVKKFCPLLPHHHRRHSLLT